MSQSPQEESGSTGYDEAWRAINLLIRADGSWSGRERNVCYHNRGDGTFEDISFVSGLDLNTDGRAFVPMDLDSDGDLDLILKNRNGVGLRAFRNDSVGAANRRMEIELRGGKSNRDAVGARVWLETESRTLMRDVSAGMGFLSQRSRRVGFGTAADERVQKLRVRWPSGGTQEFADLPSVDQLLVVESEGLSALVKRQVPERRPSVETALPAGSAMVLTEAVPAPAFDLESLGGRVALEDFAGSQVLVNFWATWCPPCRNELRDFAEHATELNEAGIKVVAISVDDPAERSKVREFAAEFNLPFAVVFADDETVNAYTVLNENLFDRRSALAIPTSFLLDEKGRVIAVYRGETRAAEVYERPLGSLPFDGKWVLSEPRRDFVELGASFAERDLPRRAIKMFEQAQARGVETPGSLNNFAVALLQIGEAQRAEQMLRRSLAMRPNQADARVNLAGILVARGQTTEALEMLEASLAIFPDDAAALDLLGSARFEAGDLEAAEADYRGGLQVAPENARLHENLGALFAASGRFDEAIEELEQARKLGANSARLHTNLGSLYMQSGMSANGLLAFRRAVRADPSDYGANLNLVMYYARTGDMRQVLQWARAAKGADPERAEASIYEARALIGLGQRAQAVGILRGVLERHPGSAEATALLRELE